MRKISRKRFIWSISYDYQYASMFRMSAFASNTYENSTQIKAQLS